MNATDYTLKLYSVGDVAHCLGITQREVYNLIKEGKIRASKVETLWRILPQDFEKYLKDCGFNSDSLQNENIGEVRASNTILSNCSSTTEKEVLV